MMVIIALVLIFAFCSFLVESPIGGFVGVAVFIFMLLVFGIIETPVNNETVTEPINAGELDDYRIVTVDTEFGSFTFRGEPELKDSGLCILTGETSKCFNPDEWIEVHISPAIER